MELLRRLCETDGISGREDGVIEIFKEELEGVADSVTVDAMKNVIAFKSGSGNGERIRVMLAAHMDEIGFVVYNVDDDGFASVAPVGGWKPTSIMGHTVEVHTRSGEVLPAVMAHMWSDTSGNRDAKHRMDKLYLDFGLPADKVRDKVGRGDWVSMDTRFRKLGDCLLAKAFDDRAGVYVILEAMKRFENPDIDVYAVGTSQEEVGLRGSTVAAQMLKPHVGVAVDMTGSGDTPGFPARMKVADLGKGVAVKQMDSSVISSPGLVEFMRRLAEEKGIDYQMEILMGGGTDTASIQKFSPGAHSVCLSVPARYGHSPVAVMHRHDLETAVDLLTEFLSAVNSDADFFAG